MNPLDATQEGLDGELAVELEQLRTHAEKEEAILPTCLPLWRELYMMRPRGVSSTYLVWRYLLDVFRSRGYELYVPCTKPGSTAFSDSAVYPADYAAAYHPDLRVNAFGLLGSRRYVCSFVPYAAVWAATNSSGDEFIIKAVSDGQNPKGLCELRILEYLSREDVRADPRNHTIPVVEFLKHKQYVFAIFPRWSGYPRTDVKTPRTAIECCAQITEGLAFLHEQRIGHLDISIENFVINFFGPPLSPIAPVVVHLPIRYGIIDFGESVFLDGVPESLASPRNYAPRPNSAPEVSSQQPFDPFAADVHQTAMFMLEQFYELTGFTPDFLPILQAMTGPPHARISMAEAHLRLAALRDAWRDDPDPDVVDKVGCRLNKYERTYINTRRPASGSVSVPMDADEARALRERMREDERQEKIRATQRPSHPQMLHVDPVPRTVGCVHGNHAPDDESGF